MTYGGRNMFRQKDRTLDMYIKLGALMRMHKWLTGKLIVEGSKVLPKTEVDKYWNRLEQFDVHYSSLMEDKMFADYPELSNAFIHVFYGGFPNEHDDEAERLVSKEARDLLGEYYEELKAKAGAES